MSEPDWILWVDGPRSGAENMRLDAALLELMDEATRPPVLRWYSFDPPCVSLGVSQRPEKAILADVIHARGKEWVRRPTGGRALLHEADMTYSLVARLDQPPFEGLGIEATYELISAALTEGLIELGVEAAWVAPGHRPAKSEFNLPCFASVSRHEICVGGQKLVGSAQRRLRGAFLQHGSIPLTEAFLGVTDFLPGEEVDRLKALGALREATTWVGAWTDLPDWETWVTAFVPPFTKFLGSKVRTITGEEGIHVLGLALEETAQRA